MSGKKVCLAMETIYRRTEHHNLHLDENLNSILTAIDNISGPVIDIARAVRTLEKYGKLEPAKCREILQKCHDRSDKEKLKTFASLIFKPGSLSFTLYILDLLGLSDLADSIVRPRVNRLMRRTKLQHSNFLQKFWFELKINIDNNTAFDRAEFLRSQAQRMKSSCSYCQNEKDKTKILYSYAVVSWLLVQECKRETSCIRTVLNDMLNCWPNNIDRRFCDIIFHSKMAIAAVMDEDIPKALEHNRVAKYLSVSLHDPLTKALVSHDSRYLQQRVYELNNSEENRQSILFETEIGLCFLESDSNGCDQFSQMMKKIFLIYVVMYRLRINNDLNVRDSQCITVEDAVASKQALQCFEQTLGPGERLDPRRGMFYLVCKARLHEQTRHFRKAESLLSRALDLATEGSHYTDEARNIRVFADRLRDREDYVVEVCKL